MNPSLAVIPLERITTTPRNPRSDLADDDEGIVHFAQHLTALSEPYFVHPPVVIVMDGGYRIVSGERRVRAARAAGWAQVACLVYPAAMPTLHEFRLRSYENLHRQELHPLDRAAMLHIEHGLATASALGCEEAALMLLTREQKPLATVQALNDLLAANGLHPTRPPVTWEQTLTRLGLAMSTDQRKRLLRLLSLEPAILERLRGLDLTETALRSIGQLEPADQEVLVAALEADPALARRLRRISRAVRDQDYTIEEAIAEARGEVLNDEEGSAEDDEDHADDDNNEEREGHESKRKGEGEGDDFDDEEGNGDAPADLPDEAMMGAVTTLLDLSAQIATALETLQATAGGDITSLPEPWGDYVEVALDTIQDGLTSIGRSS